MFEHSKAFCSFSVNDIPQAKKFYAEILGLRVSEEVMGGQTLLTLHLAGGAKVLIYPKKDHVPATYTVLNFPVIDLSKATSALESKGIKFSPDALSEGSEPHIAWFKDPAGNFLAVLEDKTLLNSIELNKFIAAGRDDVFAAWTQSDYLIKWAHPDNTSITVELFDVFAFGKYILKYSCDEGVFFATGIFKEIIKNEKLVYTCKIKGPDGLTVLDTLLIVQFHDKHVGTDVHLIQEGFTDLQILKDTQASWVHSLNKLFNLMITKFDNKTKHLSERNLHQ